MTPLFLLRKHLEDGLSTCSAAKNNIDIPEIRTGILLTNSGINAIFNLAQYLGVPIKETTLNPFYDVENRIVYLLPASRYSSPSDRAFSLLHELFHHIDHTTVNIASTLEYDQTDDELYLYETEVLVETAAAEFSLRSGWSIKNSYSEKYVLSYLRHISFLASDSEANKLSSRMLLESERLMSQMPLLTHSPELTTGLSGGGW